MAFLSSQPHPHHHPHWPSLAKSWVCIKVVIKHSINQISNFWKTRWPPWPIFHKYCLTNYSNAIQAIISRFDVQISNHNKNGRLDGTCKFCWLGILTTSDQLKEMLWIYHHQTFYTDIRWHKLGWYWFSEISEKQDGRHSQFSSNIVWPITAMSFKLSSPDLMCRWVIVAGLIHTHLHTCPSSICTYSIHTVWYQR